jgi:hypothetical protein
VKRATEQQAKEGERSRARVENHVYTAKFYCHKVGGKQPTTPLSQCEVRFNKRHQGAFGDLEG